MNNFKNKIRGRNLGIKREENHGIKKGKKEGKKCGKEELIEQK